MAPFDIQSYLEQIENDCSLFEETSFEKRIEVTEFIGFQVMGQLEEQLHTTDQPDKWVLLKDRAEKIRSRLEQIDLTLFQRLRAKIRAKEYTGNELKNLVKEYVDWKIEEAADYDNLDIFINGLSLLPTMPEQTKQLESEMVDYYKTPARVVFELVESCPFTKEDVFVDLGSGLGQVAILVNLLTGVRAKGIEFEPAFCEYARDCATGLNLANLTFINRDARKADYSEGTVFFMFTPFRGQILEEVLSLLRNESFQRKIRVITYGPCTAQVAAQDWLNNTTPLDDRTYKLTVFLSSHPPIPSKH